MDDATSLDALLPSPQGPQSAGPLMGMSSVPSGGHSQMAPSFKPSLPGIRFMVGSSTMYISFFIAAMIISLSIPRNMLLQYVPSAYTSGGVVSWTGAAILGVAAVVISNVINNFLSGFLG